MERRKRASSQSPGYFRRLYNKIFKQDYELLEHSASSFERPGGSKKRKSPKRKASNNSSRKHSFEVAPQVYTADSHQRMLKASKPKPVKSRPADFKPAHRMNYATPKSKGSAIAPYSTPKGKRPISPFRSSKAGLDDSLQQYATAAPATIIDDKPIEQVQPVPLPAQKSVKSRPPARPDPSQGALELVVRVSMKNGTEAEEIFVHEGDNAKGLCNKFCVKNKITDR